MVKKEKKILYFLLISQIYCLILGWFNGGDKNKFFIPYFFHFLSWWCVWNCLLTIFFVFWKLKLKRAKNDTFFAQVFSLIVMISNVITVTIYTIGLLIWLITALTTYFGITNKSKKFVPIPSHVIYSNSQLFKVIHWWLYSPLWHLIAPTYFIYWFFRYTQVKLLKKKLKLTIFFCLIQPTIYFSYCYLRSKFGEKWYFKEFSARWPYAFFSSKKMTDKLGIGNYRWVWKIVLVLFFFSLFSLIVYLSLKFSKKVKNLLLGKKECLVKLKMLKKRELERIITNNE